MDKNSHNGCHLLQRRLVAKESLVEKKERM